MLTTKFLAVLLLLTWLSSWFGGSLPKDDNAVPPQDQFETQGLFDGGIF